MEADKELCRLYSEAKWLLREPAASKPTSAHGNLLQRPLENYQSSLFQSYSPLHSGQDNESKKSIIESRLQIMNDQTDRKRQLRDLATSISLIECRALGAELYSKLPRELRDSIYDYLLDDKEVRTMNDRIECDSGKDAIRNSEKPWRFLAPIFAQAKFIGPDVSHEIGSWYFRKLMTAEVDYDMVPAFLRIAEFGGQPFRPIDVMPTLNVSVLWNLENSLDFKADALKECMDSLLTLKPRRNFSINIYLSRDFQFSRNLFEALEVMRPGYKALLKKGIKTRVLGYRFFTPQWRYSTASPPRSTCTTSEILDYYFFHRSPEDWLAMKGEEVQMDKQPIRRRKNQDILLNMWKNLQDAKQQAVVNGPPLFSDLQ